MGKEWAGARRGVFVRVARIEEFVENHKHRANSHIQLWNYWIEIGIKAGQLLAVNSHSFILLWSVPLSAQAQVSWIAAR